jgi:hypothetical protein
MSVNEVLEAVRTMSPEERAEVRALLEALGTESNAPPETARLRLFEAGLLAEIRPRPRVANARSRQSPARINGKPLSETVIEERG